MSGEAGGGHYYPDSEDEDAWPPLTVEDVPRPAPAPVTALDAAGPVTRAFCTCKQDHPCYRADIRECYEFADGPDGLCGKCRPRGSARPGHSAAGA